MIVDLLFLLFRLAFTVFILFVPFGFVFKIPKGMVDYQHVLPVHADVARRKKRSWAEVEPHLGEALTSMFFRTLNKS